MKVEEISHISSKLIEAESKVNKSEKEIEELKRKVLEREERAQSSEKDLTDIKSLKENLEKEVKVLHQSSEQKSDEVKRLSGSITG